MQALATNTNIDKLINLYDWPRECPIAAARARNESYNAAKVEVRNTSSSQFGCVNTPPATKPHCDKPFYGIQLVAERRQPNMIPLTKCLADLATAVPDDVQLQTGPCPHTTQNDTMWANTLDTLATCMSRSPECLLNPAEVDKRPRSPKESERRNQTFINAATPPLESCQVSPPDEPPPAFVRHPGPRCGMCCDKHIANRARESAARRIRYPAQQQPRHLGMSHRDARP